MTVTLQAHIEVRCHLKRKRKTDALLLIIREARVVSFSKHIFGCKFGFGGFVIGLYRRQNLFGTLRPVSGPGNNRERWWM